MNNPSPSGEGIKGWGRRASRSQAQRTGEADARRDAVLRARGFPTIRFTNDDVMVNMDGVLTVILRTLEAIPDRQWVVPDSPTPPPPLKGRG